MPQPFNYMIDVKNPFEEAINGYQTGVAIQKQRQQQKIVEEQRAQAFQMQKDLAELSSNQNASSEDYGRIMTKYPQLADHFKKSWDVLSSGQQQQKLSQLSQVYSALDSGSTDVAKELLQEQQQAAINSGLTDEAKKSEVMLKLIETNPNAAKSSVRMALSTVMGPEKFISTFETLSKIGEGKIGTYKFDEKVGMINTITGDVLTSVKELGLPNTDPEKKFDQENKLRQDFNGITKDFRLVRDSIARVRASSEEPSAAGDLALIFNYMKILDPGSTVREGEFANAQNSAGIPDILRAQYNKLNTGERLSDTQRKDFLNRANKLFEKRQNQYKQTSSEYKNLAKRYNLSPENVVLSLDIVEEPSKEIQENKDPLNLGL